MLAYAKEVRDPERSGRRTYDDMARRVLGKLDVDDPEADDNDRVIGATLADIEGPVGLDELNEATAAHTAHGDPVLSGKCALSKLVFALRRRGYVDTGEPGTPTFDPDA